MLFPPPLGKCQILGGCDFIRESYARTVFRASVAESCDRYIVEPSLFHDGSCFSIAPTRLANLVNVRGGINLLSSSQCEESGPSERTVSNRLVRRRATSSLRVPSKPRTECLVPLTIS